MAHFVNITFTISLIGQVFGVDYFHIHKSIGCRREREDQHSVSGDGRGRICQRLDAHFNTKLINHLSGAGWQNMRAQQLISLSRGARNLTPPLTIILSSLSSLASRAGFAFLLARYIYTHPTRTIQMNERERENRALCVEHKSRDEK